MKTYCDLPFIRIKIDSDGSYQSCCHQTDYYGNILDETFDITTFFKSPKIVEVKNSVLSNKLHKSCNNQQCPKFYKNLEDKPYSVSLSKYPTQIELNLPSELCNIGGLKPTPDTACIMCPRSSKSFMDLNISDRTFEILDKLKPAIPYLNTFTVLGIAEPFWKNKLFEVFDYINFKQYKNDIFFWTYSNGSVFNPTVQEIYLNEYVNRTCIGFSLDAATQETYTKIRRLKVFNKITKNLEAYFNKTHNESVKRDWSFVSHNINLLNLHEMEQMVRYSKNIGANRIQFTLTYVTDPGMKLDRNYLINETNWKMFWEISQRAVQVGKEINQEIEFYVPFHGGYLK